MSTSCHDNSSKRPIPDFLLWGSFIVIALAVISYSLYPDVLAHQQLFAFAEHIFDISSRIWWGVFVGVLFVGVLEYVPESLIQKVLGKPHTFSGIIRAALAGVLLDLCSHGIVMVGVGLYRKGASLGQMMAFLIASPWNSFSLTFILWGLVGLKLMLIILFLSLLIAILSGLFIDHIERSGWVENSPYERKGARSASLIKTLKKSFKKISLRPMSLIRVVYSGFRGSRMVLRWIFFGVVIASIVRTIVSIEHFEDFFGPTLAGLGLTLIIATVLEVCSEGSVPFAADFTLRAGAPGNTFAFLMTGVSTDYTEIMAIKDTTRSWKKAFVLPLVTIPQIILLGYLLNQGVF